MLVMHEALHRPWRFQEAVQRLLGSWLTRLRICHPGFQHPDAALGMQQLPLQPLLRPLQLEANLRQVSKPAERVVSSKFKAW